MKRDITLAILGLALISAGTLWRGHVARAPASLLGAKQSANQLGLKSVDPSFNSGTENSVRSSIKVPTARKLSNNPNHDAGDAASEAAWELSLSNKIANDSRYARIFNLDEIKQLSHCALSRASQSMPLTAFRTQISSAGSQGNRIFMFCAIQIHSSKVASQKAAKDAKGSSSSEGTSATTTADNNVNLTAPNATGAQNSTSVQDSSVPAPQITTPPVPDDSSIVGDPSIPDPMAYLGEAWTFPSV